MSDDFEFSMSLDTPREVTERIDRLVDATGCPACRTLSLTGPHLCEHGVTPAPVIEAEISMEIDDPDVYRRLLGGADA